MAITVQQSNKGGGAAEDERTRTAGGIFRKVERKTRQSERWNDENAEREEMSLAPQSREASPPSRHLVQVTAMVPSNLEKML